jgi:hypothetical protein
MDFLTSLIKENTKGGKQMRRKIIAILAAFCFVLVAQRGKAYAQEETKSKFRVIDTAFCSEAEMDFDKRWCSSSNVKFPVDIGRLYCCTKIFASENGEISHNWIFEGESLTPIELKVSRSPGYRTRSYKTLSPKHIGNWKVEVEAEGEVLVTLPITITPSEEPTEEPKINLPSVSPDEQALP